MLVISNYIVIRLTSSLEMVPLSKSSSKKTASSLENIELSSFSSIEFVTNQLGTIFDAERQAATVFFHTFLGPIF